MSNFLNSLPESSSLTSVNTDEDGDKTFEKNLVEKKWFFFLNFKRKVFGFWGSIFQTKRIGFNENKTFQHKHSVHIFQIRWKC
jgi:hypothetical protein